MFLFACNFLFFPYFVTVSVDFFFTRKMSGNHKFYSQSEILLLFKHWESLWRQWKKGKASFGQISKMWSCLLKLFSRQLQKYINVADNAKQVDRYGVILKKMQVLINFLKLSTNKFWRIKCHTSQLLIELGTPSSQDRGRLNLSN